MSRNYLIIAIIAIIVAAVVIVLEMDSQERVLEDVLIENDTYSLSFNYWAGQDGYELIESSTSDDFLHSYVLVDAVALDEFRSNDSETAPPTMSIFVFQLPDNESPDGERVGRITRLQNWAQSNAGITSYEQIYGTPEIIEIDGVKALEYTTDGTYQQTIYLASYRGFVYMFVGQYDRPTDFVKADFDTLMESVRFE